MQRVGIALGEQARDALVVAERWAEIAVQDTLPVVKVLFAEGGVEAKGVARGRDIGCRRSLAQHLLDRISWDQVDKQENEGDDEPDYWKGVDDALEKQTHD